ncbi:crotonobetainyl-CoA:carnitine CoA-transferase CaiB-like acyl-CoA transferase [Stella humosa]|uniref:Crotonobetainyl-CoA:carnitine CoA-transferase CaiB-like acyl-CoA transferase n=1 Tax=Stella humosa TaxID=94 RepID=A0A3N1KZT7_9PROT|nr:CoA transferase [Stella humosa]ROP84299.1 crotonobetainyl-CoA:carnitine CoA-transferase CaiB-like acyl-CoA transferase [Stella humosa]BBK33812.1 CoA transferase [Stella humosa]
MSQAPRPLAGLKVIAVEQYGAAPFGTLHLAQLGAEVIKIENPQDGGDVSRTVGPHFIEGVDPTAASGLFQALNLNKRSVTLDLSQAGGRAVLARLAGTADALIHNLRGDVPARLGLTRADLAPFNPRLVVVHLTGYGREPERARWPGYDFLMQAEAGHFALTGDPDGPPARFGLPMIDYAAGLSAALGLVSAVMAARTSGQGCEIDVSLFDTALFHLSYIGQWRLTHGHVQGRERRSAHAALVPCQLYRTGDGWIYLMCNKEKFWGALCRAIGRPEWIEDERFRRFPDRKRHRDLIETMLDDALSARTTAEWMAVFAGQVPAAPVHDIAQALDNPFVTTTGRLQDVATGEGSFRAIAGPVRVDGQRAPLTAAPALGADTDAVLAEIGYGAAEIAEMRRQGIA